MFPHTPVPEGGISLWEISEDFELLPPPTARTRDLKVPNVGCSFQFLNFNFCLYLSQQISTQLTDTIQGAAADDSLLRGTASPRQGQSSWRGDLELTLLPHLGQWTRCFRWMPHCPALTSLSAFLGPDDVLVSTWSSYRRKHITPCPPPKAGVLVQRKLPGLGNRTNRHCQERCLLKPNRPDLSTGALISWSNSTVW